MYEPQEGMCVCVGGGGGGGGLKWVEVFFTQNVYEATAAQTKFRCMQYKKYKKLKVENASVLLYAGKLGNCYWQIFGFLKKKKEKKKKLFFLFMATLI